MPKNRLTGRINLLSPKQKIDLSQQDVDLLRTFRQSISKRLNVKFYDLEPDWIHERKMVPTLFNTYSKYFKFWYNKDIDLYTWSSYFSRLSGDHFDEWWNPNEFNWKYSSNLIQNQSARFTHWWNPSKFDGADYSMLANCCSNYFDVWWNKSQCPDNSYIYSSLINRCSDHFDKWWNPELIFEDADWYSSSYMDGLLRRCSNHFDIWWNPNIFDYSKFYRHINTFFTYARWHFHTWFDKEKIKSDVWEAYSWLFAQKFPEHFDIWFDRQTFNYGTNVYRTSYYKHAKKSKQIGRHFLMQHCSEHFDKWYDKRKIRPTRANLDILNEFCYDHHEKWGADFIILQLKEEGL